MLRIAPTQLALFPWRKPWDSSADMGRMGRDRRTASQWLRSIKGYLEWRAGLNWRERNDPERWDYIAALRVVQDAQYATPRKLEPVLPSLHPVCSPSPSSELLTQPRSVLAAELIALDPALTNARLLSRLPRPKLVAMVDERRARFAAAERRLA